MIHDICDKLYDTVRQNQIKANDRRKFMFSRKTLHIALNIQDVHQVDITPILSLEGMDYACALFPLALNRVIDLPFYESSYNLSQTDSFKKKITEVVMNNEESKRYHIELKHNPFASETIKKKIV